MLTGGAENLLSFRPPITVTEQPTIKKRLLLALKILLSAAAVFIIYKKVDIKAVSGYLASANLFWLMAAFIVFFISKAISALRLNQFFKQHGVVLSEKQNLFLYLLGMFYNLFVPLVGGEAYKIYFIHQRQGTPVKSLVWASLHDRASGLVALTVFAILFFVWSSLNLPYKVLSVAAIPVGYAVYYFGLRIFFKEYLPVFTGSNLLSLAVQATQILCSYCVLMSLGVNEHIADYLFVFLLSCYAYMIPVIGAREMAFVFGAQAMHLDMNLSLAISLFFYLSLAATSLTGVVFLFKPDLLEQK